MSVTDEVMQHECAKEKAGTVSFYHIPEASTTASPNTLTVSCAAAYHWAGGFLLFANCNVSRCLLSLFFQSHIPHATCGGAA